jgi:hypothetical protein
LDGSPNPKPIPVAFFFPDDPTVTDEVKPAKKGKETGKPAKP